ncbi:thiamine pyrophosphate-dependent dehydrogenase E1 component subunit alpha [Hyphococcus formosus]|uniref:thiamine pyrophosphate-dependent dehydrogenase E1 component subunit alpha n=1 Tax=Hyphococcus formosus TaxID=3143534 RepID=UPI00398B4262
MSPNRSNEQMPSPADERWMYGMMVKSRLYEEAIKAAYLEGKQPLFDMAAGPIPGEMHLSNGQEPCAVGVCTHLGKDDFVTATHRPHHIAIAKGVDLDAMTAEIFGRETGLSGGRGGHMHLFDPEVNFCCSGIIAEGMGPAVGAALSFQMRGLKNVAVSFIGEGAANQGAFHEALNLAAVWRLPVVFVIEDNAWGISVAKSKSTAVERNSARAAAYGMPGEFVENNDPIGVYVTAARAIERARAGDGPTLIEIETQRLEGHFMGDTEDYRPKEEREAVHSCDPIPLMRQSMIERSIFSAEDAENIEAEVKAEVDRALAFARASAEPAPEQALTCVFS